MPDTPAREVRRGGLLDVRGRALTLAIELEEPQRSWVLSTGVLLTAGLVFGGIAWAWVTPLVEVAHTEGAILPAGRTHRVQHLEGGIVHEVHVRDGDYVQQGALLVELSRRSAGSEVAQVDARLATLTARIARLDALLGGRDDLPGAAASDPLQRQLFNEQRSSHDEQVRLIDAERTRLEQEVVAKRAQAVALERAVALLEERQGLQQLARERAVIPRVELLEADARLAQSVSQLREVQAEILGAEEGIRGALQKRAEFESRWRQDLRLEVEEATAELAEVRAERSRVSDRLERAAIVAPVAGVVQALAVNSTNAVVEPGQVILEIVPVDDELLVEARVWPKDIGHLRPGQRVDVKVTGFETQRFGSLDGSLRAVSASTYLDEERQPYYRAEILLAANHLGDDPQRNRLLPGMTVQADIRTGEKTVLEYLLKPVYRGLGEAMHER